MRIPCGGDLRLHQTFKLEILMRAVCVVLALSAIAFASTHVSARPIHPWSDSELMEKSDLVVLATFESSKDSSGFPSGKDPKIGVTTTFLVDAYIKGRIEGKTQFVRVEGKPKRKIKLHHYRYAHPESNIRVVDGPSLVRFDGQPRQ